MTVDYGKLKVADIQQMLVEEEFFTQEQIDCMTDVKGKTQWAKLHQTLNGEFNQTETKFQFEIPEEEKGVVIEKLKDVPETPKYYDIEWQDYVMSQFDEKELITERKSGKKYPTVNGLRRVVELLLGEIVDCGPINMETTMIPDIPGKAVVTYEIVIEWKLNQVYQWDGVSSNGGYPLKHFRALGSSWVGNTDDMFAVFPEAIAETRAEGRALRRALRLGVVCADELTSKNTAEITRQSVEKASNEKSTDGDWQESSVITDNQINTIKVLCDRLGIDVVKFINSGSKRYEDIIKIPRQTAANMIKRLNEYQSSERNSVDVPSELLIVKNVGEK